MTRFARIAPVLFAAALSGLSGASFAATTTDETIGRLPAVTISQSAAGLADDAAPDAVASPAPRHVRHARLQTVDTASLAQPTTSALSRSVPSAASLVMQAHATALRPAPLPNQDFDAPGPDAATIASQQQASLAPSFYSPGRQFSGDGFSAGSNLETDKNNRRKPGGGMSLSIPMP